MLCAKFRLHFGDTSAQVEAAWTSMTSSSSALVCSLLRSLLATLKKTQHTHTNTPTTWKFNSMVRLLQNLHRRPSVQLSLEGLSIHVVACFRCLEVGESTNRGCEAIPSSSPLEGFCFLGSCSETREQVGISTGAVLSNTEDGAAGPSGSAEARFVNGLVMTNLDYTHSAFDERGPSEIRKECSLEEAMGHAAKEIGGRQTGKSAGKTASLKRTFQDRPEAPLRKRIHVCDSELGAVGIRMSDDDVRAKDNAEFPDLPSRWNSSKQGVDADGGVMKYFTDHQLQGNPEFANAVVGEDVEMTEVADGSGEDKAVDSGLPRAEEMSVEGTRDAGTLRATEVENRDSLRRVNLRDTHTPASASEFAGLERTAELWGDGMGNGVPSSRGLDSSDGSLRKLASEKLGGSFQFPSRSLRSSDFASPASSSGREALNDLTGGRKSFEGREDDGENEEDLNKHVELSSEDEERSRNEYKSEDVVILEDDESENDDDFFGDNTRSSNGRPNIGTEPVTRPAVLPNGIRLSTSRNASEFVIADAESDSDDCQVVGEYKPPANPVANPQQRNRADSAARYDYEDDSESEDDRSEESDSSDVEVAGGPQSDIQRLWEEAALRRRMGRAMKSAGSKVNGEREATTDLDVGEGVRSEGLVESVATSIFRDSPDSTAESSEARGGAEGFLNPYDGQGGANLATRTEVRVPGTLNLNEQIKQPPTDFKDFKDIRPQVMTGDKNESTLSEPYEVKSLQEEPSSSDVRISSGNEPRQEETVSGDDADDGDLIARKERLKQTPEFRQADKQEWASREQEVRRQQQEAQRQKKLRQREKLEADRKQEMERKQKQRVQELRLNQMKAEKDMDEKEQLRGRVRERLEFLASRCTDLASLLRQLGIKVEGGSNPSEAQVNAAVKRALVTFHPDRVGDGDVKRLVEAEETFKLINRRKK
ncbi:hypothetical protein R1flu_012296 [Riccia fluitans]|uniref:J domain-containing protein n=1 Tax=Riccia fluitans TaxID=41844 RepID=A0ABD1ZBD1_9MARC